MGGVTACALRVVCGGLVLLATVALRGVRLRTVERFFAIFLTTGFATGAE